MPDALAQGFEPQTPLERIDMTEDGYQPALMQSGNDLPTPCAMAAQAGQHAHFDLVPCRFAPGLASLWAKRPKYSEAVIWGNSRFFSTQVTLPKAPLFGKDRSGKVRQNNGLF